MHTSSANVTLGHLNIIILNKVGLPMWKMNLRISSNLYHAHEKLTDA